MSRKTPGVLLLLALLASPAYGAGGDANVQAASFSPSFWYFVVAYHDRIPSDVETRLILSGGTLVRRDDLLAFVVARTDQVTRFVQGMTDDPAVRFVEEDPRILALSNLAAGDAAGASLPPGFPNDPSYRQECNGRRCQWALDMVSMQDAWATTLGSQDVIVAIVDTGVDHTHPDISANILRQNGAVVGLDLVEGDADPMDTFGHGTALAGIVAAQIDNGQGLPGACQCRIMPVRVTTGTGSADREGSLAASGIAWAAANGARVITASFSLRDPQNLTLQMAIDFANARGALVVAAAGNTNGGSLTDPGRMPGVVAVTALGTNGDATAYAARGPQIDLAAPGGNGRNGGNLHSTSAGGGLGFYSGTSYAVGYVAGAAGLLWSKDLLKTAAQVRSALEDTATPLGDAATYGKGRLEAGAALSAP